MFLQSGGELLRDTLWCIIHEWRLVPVFEFCIRVSSVTEAIQTRSCSNVPTVRKVTIVKQSELTIRCDTIFTTYRVFHVTKIVILSYNATMRTKLRTLFVRNKSGSFRTNKQKMHCDVNLILQSLPKTIRNIVRHCIIHSGQTKKDPYSRHRALLVFLSHSCFFFDV